jgi:phosphoribosylformylglycinamidine cyclo-ligase
MAVVVEAADADSVSNQLEGAGETVFEIGRIEEGPRGCTVAGKEGSWNSPKDWSATHNA